MNLMAYFGLGSLFVLPTCPPPRHVMYIFFDTVALRPPLRPQTAPTLAPITNVELPHVDPATGALVIGLRHRR